MKGKLVKDLSKYKVLSGPSAGAGWANEFLGKGYRAGDFFLVTIDEKGKYLAFDDPSEIQWHSRASATASWLTASSSRKSSHISILRGGPSNPLSMRIGVLGV